MNTGSDIWREVRTTNLYDANLIAARIRHLRQLADEGDINKILFALRAGTSAARADVPTTSAATHHA